MTFKRITLVIIAFLFTSAIIDAQEVGGKDIKVDLYPDIVVNSKKFNAVNEPVLLKEINVIDVLTGEITVKDILLADKKIQEVANGIKVKSTYKILEAKGKWLIPGLVDSHIHLFQSGGLYTRPDVINLKEFKDYEVERTWLKRYAGDILKRYLRCGITTVIDVGGPLYNFEIRDKYSDETLYPNIFLTGPLVSTYQPEAFKIEDAPIIKANTPQEAIDLVKKQIPYKPDFIKIWYINTSEKEEILNYEIVKATIKEAHKNNLKVAVHATQLKTAKKAINAGADFLVHSVEDKHIDQEFIDLIKNKDVAYIPTLVVGDNYLKAFSQQIEPSKEDFNLSNPIPLGSLYDSKRIAIAPEFKRYINFAKKRLEKEKNEIDIKAINLKNAIANGFIVATGTDAGNIGTLHATSYYDEVKAMKKAGLTNLDILKASTINGAKVLGMATLFGSVEEGKMADLVILKSNPLKDINALKDIDYVVKGGSVFQVNDIIKDSPEVLVQRQVNGYNARNIEAFLEPYSENFEVYNFPNILSNKGKVKMRESYSTMFKKYPKLHCEIVERMVLGSKVIDHERITGIRTLPIEAIAIYEIEKGKIAKVTFINK